MTIKELIEKLKELPDYLKIKIFDFDLDMPIDIVGIEVVKEHENQNPYLEVLTDFREKL